MAHISTLGAGLFTDLSVATPATALNKSELTAQSAFDAFFATAVESKGGAAAAGAFVRVKNIREFPALGTPPNITNVPQYGQAMSSQVSGQADAPTLEIALNFVPSEVASGTLLGDLIGSGKLVVLRFALLNQEPTAGYASTAANLGTVENTIWYLVGKLESLQVTPNLTDANQATLTLSADTDFYGPWTIDAGGGG